MTTLRAIVVDDEQLARRGLILRLQQLPQIEVVAECSNGQQALQQVAQLAPDLLFLDIQMPQMDGLALVRELQADTMPLIIFVTAYDQYAIQAFNVHAVDYLLKPLDEQRLQVAVERAVARHSSGDADNTKARVVQLLQSMTAANQGQQTLEPPASAKPWPERLTIKDGNEYRFIRVEDIQWVDAAGDYMCLHTASATHILRSTMKQLEQMLNPEVFWRIHRSSIVNAGFIASAQSHSNGEFLLTLENGSQLKVSRNYRDRVQPLFNR